MSKLIKLFSLFLSLNIFAQQESFKINGDITDRNQNQIPSAEIYLFTANNELVKTTIAQDGNFEFSGLKPAQYYLHIVSNEITHNESLFQLSSDITLNIKLNEKVSEIEEVQISRTRNPFKVHNGNIDIDLANSSLNKVATSTDLLAKLPFVSVDANGEGLSMVGKGVPLLYIDNQKVDFTVLSALSVDDIKSVEIIRNPSAKYEAEGKAVIKVVLKNSKKKGYRLTLNETAVFNKRFSNNFSANFQQKKNKTEWKINAAYNQIQHWESNGFDYSVPSKNISSDYIITSITNRPQVILGASLYQELKDGDHLTFTINGNLRPDKGGTNTVTNYEENGLKSQILTLNHQDRQRATINSIFNYNKPLKSINATIFTGLQYTRESNNVDLDFYNNIDNEGYIFSQFRKQKYSVNAFSGRIDAEKKIKENYQLGIGGSFTKAEAITDNFTDYRNINPSEFFKYFFNEENWASYAEFSGEKEKLSFKGGIRLETTSANGFNKILDETNINRHYVDWFPSAELSFKQNENYVYTVHFKRSISRPSYSDLASGAFYSSPYVEYQGNPNLLPSYTIEVSASLNLKKWAINASVYQIKNPIGFGLFYDETESISKFTTKNFDRESGASLGLDVPFQYKILTSQNSLSFNYSKTEDGLAVVNQSTPYLYLYTNNTIKIGKGFNFLLDGTWITKRTQGVYEYNEMVLINLGLTKSVSNFDFTLRYNDVFNQNKYVQKLSYEKIITKGSFYGNTPVLSIGLKYSFGKVSNSEYKEKRINETVDRI
ncbi:outer membrane beta-barrel family protein [Kaistella sp. PBT33-4]|uniref:outer membrane beta-barrel family protein n=1 Tax=Kaistella sp. PBT33-4 TaxID=3032000 RepID=UPI0023D82817|nr:outer membrane beta-barrel family protein [Kaistella sp. PBT33-4]MDF0720618.1 outer membrane beta-barrel family protein [Kaistella sp. PBT33-4]